MLLLQLSLHKPTCLVQLPWSQFLSSILFWAILLGMKGAFDYWVVILPLKSPVQTLWHRGWLSTCKGRVVGGGWDLAPAELQTAVLIMRRQCYWCPHVICGTFSRE